MTITRTITLSVVTLTAAVVGPIAQASLTSSASALASDCPSGYLCVWSGASYSGTMKKFSATGQFTVVDLSTKQSIYNNRSKRALLEKQRSGSDVNLCLAPGASRSNLSGWQETAEGVYLSTATTC